MVWPILIAAAAALVLGGAATVVVLNWDSIVTAWRGKRVAVLGAREVGKTCLVKFLSTGSIPENYEQTTSAEKASGRRFSLKDLDLKIDDTLDVPGDSSHYADWKEVADRADLVLYLLRADRLFAGDAEVEERIRDDVRHIGSWLRARTKRPRFFVVGTHCDLDPAFANLTRDKVGDYYDRYRKLPVVAELVSHCGGAKHVTFVLGSMVTEQVAEALVYDIFRKL
ncbi:GTPase domain-containing protein [Arenibaculum sp.]|jgi:GTPase SAR1 family protein|uniref:GTPase domain-containing protein n=1 Tax=Arenibaculum sp. TaxID=2865862 RepID=UPI002E0E7984|nr:GTPase domain-containing protein [Arenibaculum sp.]